MNAQKLASIHPDLHEKYQQIMGMDVKSDDKEKDHTHQDNKATESVLKDAPDKPAHEEKLLMAHADDGQPTPPTNHAVESKPTEEKKDPSINSGQVSSASLDSAHDKSSEQGKDDKYEKILEHNMDEMSDAPQTSGVTEPPASSSVAPPPSAPVQISGETKKKPSFMNEVIFALMGLLILAVYTLIWMRLLNFKL